MLLLLVAVYKMRYDGGNDGLNRVIYEMYVDEYIYTTVVMMEEDVNWRREYVNRK